MSLFAAGPSSPASTTTPKNTNRSPSIEEEPDMVLTEDEDSTSKTAASIVIPSRRVFKVNFASSSSNTLGTSSAAVVAASLTMSSSEGAKKPTVHPSLSVDSLTSIHSNEQKLQQQVASPARHKKPACINTDNNPAENEDFDQHITDDLQKLDMNVIEVSVGNTAGSGYVLPSPAHSQHSPASNGSNAAEKHTDLDMLANTFGSQRPSPQKQYDIVSKLIAQYQASPASTTPPGSDASDKLMFSFGYVLHAPWLRQWLAYVQDPTNEPEPSFISNYELVEESTAQKLWKAKKSALASSSVSLLNLLDSNNNNSAPVGAVHSSNNNNNADNKLYLTSKYSLRANLAENVDYFVVPKDSWEALYRWFGGGPPLPRSLAHVLEKSPYFPFFYHLTELLLPASHTATDGKASKKASSSKGSCNPDADVVAQAKNKMEHATYQQLLDQDLYPGKKEAVPCVKDVVLLEQKMKELLQAGQMASLGEDPAAVDGAVRVRGTGKEEMYELPESDNAVAAVVQKDSKAAATAADEEKAGQAGEAAKAKKDSSKETCCSVCQKPSKLRCSRCSQVFYCTTTCQKAHWATHKVVCKSLAAAGNGSLSPASKAGSGAAGAASTLKPGKIGLNNLGNSCYMNSSLQCLSHIAPLRDFFLSNAFLAEVNPENRDGTKGELVTVFAKLLQDLWRPESSPNVTSGNKFGGLFGKYYAVTPSRFKAVLGKMNPEYAGLQQQDAHEVIELLLDKMHEDVNRISKKPYTEKIEGDGSNDLAIARDTWARHTLRESSRIKDTVGGLMRSQLTCPTCHRVSVSYEYHNTVQIAIPRNYNITLSLVFVPEVPSQRLDDMDQDTFLQTFALQRFSITLDRLCTIKTLKQQIKQEKHIAEEFLALSNGNLILMEASSQQHKTAQQQQQQQQPAEAEAELHHPVALKFLGDSQLISAVGGQSVVYVYTPNMSNSLLSFVHLRTLPFLDQQDTAASPSTDEGEEDRIKKSLRYFGLPLLLSMDSKWTTRRVQFHIWLNLLPYLSSSAQYAKQAFALVQGKNVNEQLDCADKLSVRVISSDGVAVWSKKVSDNEDSVAAASILGARLPVDKPAKVLIETFLKDVGFYRLFGTSSPPHFVVDCLGDWAQALHVELLEEHDISPASHHQQHHQQPAHATPSKGRRVRHNSTILTLEECIAEHTKSEVLEDGNEWYCSVCKEHKKARKVVSFCPEYLPQVLVLSLKRFEFRSVNAANTIYGQYGHQNVMMHREKIDTYVEFPLKSLNLAPFCDHNRSAQPPSSVEDDDGIFYDLFAVCNHYGRMGFGHYTAMARDWNVEQQQSGQSSSTSDLGDQWYVFDDQSVTPCPARDVRTPSAYILFYRRRN